ncbi:HAD family acid phosphatase [Streptomyces sp. NPDC102274]|uniref:HAD family acid phosphatase n=1 Tax=Streptomyces sp. NPDC102274 TaxID=3366151 RepID=UPI00382C99B0
MAVAATVVASLAAYGGTALATSPAPAEHVADARVDITNLDSVKERIRAYYGDNTDAEGEHHASDDSQWANEVRKADTRALSYVQQRVKRGAEKPAIVLDIDDTALSTYDYGANNDFAYHSDAALAQAMTKSFPAIAATRDLAVWAHDHGVAVFFVTGRPEVLRTVTETNLDEAGYPAPDGLFTSPDAASLPGYLHCTGSCTTTQYKAGTRAHLEAKGYNVLLSLGDQDSDLRGGHTDATFKLPNPGYIIP